jgi:hypothetical protein
LNLLLSCEGIQSPGQPGISTKSSGLHTKQGSSRWITRPESSTQAPVCPLVRKYYKYCFLHPPCVLIPIVLPLWRMACQRRDFIRFTTGVAGLHLLCPDVICSFLIWCQRLSSRSTYPPGDDNSHFTINMIIIS